MAIKKQRAEQFTLQVVTSRDLEDGLSTIYQFLKAHFPIDVLNIHIYDAQRGRLHFISAVTDEGVMVIDEKIKLSSAGHQAALDSLKNKVHVWEYPSTDPLMTEISEFFALAERRSSIRAITALEESRYGGIGFDAFGGHRYGKKHIQLMDDLFDPLAGAVRHIVGQLDLSSQRNRLLTENRELRKRINNRIIGIETGLKEVMTLVDQVAHLESPVLLMGETGVGKEIVSNAIHQRSNRRTGPLICFNCGAVPETLIESELFGYEKGAFTGATETKRGYFEQADGGTVFMDEIGELSLKAQVKLLRFLETMQLRRVGGQNPLSIDVRFIAATNRNLQAMVEEGLFREDLWYRLNVYPIHIPPLRERLADISELTYYFASLKSKEMNLYDDVGFAPEAMDQLRAYNWPGNVRELQNVIERALIVSRGEPLSFSNLTGPRHKVPAGNGLMDPGGFPTMDELIINHIRKSLVIANGKINGPGGAAELLGLNPSTLRGKMRKLGIKIGRTAS